MTRYLTLALLFTGIIGVSTFVACDKDDNNETTLYDRLGGITGISTVVDQFIVNVAGDNTINTRFAATVANPARARLLRLNLIDQICAGAGGPCTYKGLTMKDAHKNMNISQVEFDALVGDLVAALDQAGVQEKEKNELLAILGPMKTDIVGQ